MKLTAMTTAILLASIAVAGTSTQIANKPKSDGLGGGSSGVYRIPAMAKSTNGVIVAVSDCRYNSSGDLPNVIDIVEVWSGDNGATWSRPRIGIDVPNTNNYEKACNIGDPCIVYDPVGNKFWLMGITGGGLASSHDSSGNSRSDVVLYTRGTGENDAWQEWTGGPAGNTRSVKQMILDSLAEVDTNATNDEDRICGILQGPGHGIAQRQTVFASDGETVLMPKDALVFPMQYFSIKRSENSSSWASYSWAFAVYSTDGGATWKSTKLAPTRKAQESCIMELDDGSWVMMAKCQSGGERYFFRTTDYLNWTKYDSLTPSAACQGSCLWLGKGTDGKSRYVSCFAETGNRADIALHFGIDDSADKSGLGIIWNRSFDNVIVPGNVGTYAYNSLVMVDDDTLGILLEVGGHLTFRTEEMGGLLEEVWAAFDWTPGQSPNGWFSSWSGGNTGAKQSVVGPHGTNEFLHVVGSDWNPYASGVTPLGDAFTFAVYGSADDVTASSGELAVLWCMGRKEKKSGGIDADGEKTVLVKDADGHIKLTQMSATNATTLTAIDAGKVTGYHLFTVRFSATGGASLQIDNGPVYANAEMTMPPGKGFQVGSLYGGAIHPYVMGSGFVVCKMLAYQEADLPTAQYASLCESYPCARCVATSTSDEVEWVFPQDGTGHYGPVNSLEIGEVGIKQTLVFGGTNAVVMSVLAELPEGMRGEIAGCHIYRASSGENFYAFAYSNGDGTFSLGHGTTTNYVTSSAVADWTAPHVWTFAFAAQTGAKLYCDGVEIASSGSIKWSNTSVTDTVTFGNDPRGGWSLSGAKIYAVHTDFGVGSAIFTAAEDAANSPLADFDFLADCSGEPIANQLAVFDLYKTTGVTTTEVTHECVLRISEIMPKPTDAQNRGNLEGMDVNGLESGWVEVENTSDKWADLADYRFIRVNRGKKTDPAGVGNFPSRLVPPHGRAIFYTSERYSNSKDKAVSAFAEGKFDGKPMIFENYGNILVWGDKVNPKKSPYVRLYYAPGGDSDKGTVVDTVVVPSDLPEGWSIIVGDAAEGEGTRRWMCPTPTRGSANAATSGLTRIGPNVGPLYEKKGQKKTDFANEFAAPVPPAVPGTDYTVTLPVNAVMNPDGTFTPRAADQIQSLKFVYRKDLDDTTLVTNDIAMATKTTDANWGDQYTATIPASYFPTAGHLMQWKVLITDGEGEEWTSPSFNNKDDGYEWYGTIVEPGELNSATLPTWHMFASGNHLTQMDVDKDDQNLSLVPNYARIAIYDSSTSNYYDYVRIDLRGNTSANFTKKGHGLRFAKAHPLTMVDSVTGEMIEEIRKTSLISEFADPSFMRQMIAFWLFRKMGNHVPFDFPVRCNLNGEFYQLAFNSERFTDELIEDVYRLDKFGYGYKNVGTLKSGSGTTAGDIEKKTPDDEDESNITVLQSELRSRITAAQNVSGTSAAAKSSTTTDTTGLDNAALTKFVVQKFDLPAWLNYLASAKITQEMDDVWANICAYYDNPAMHEGARGKGTWMPLGYDFNISFGQYYQGDIGSKIGLMSNLDWFKSHPFYGGNRVRCWKQSGMTGTCNEGNDGFEAVWQSSKFRRLYLRRLRTLMDQELKEPGTPESEVPFMVKMREMANLMRADSVLDLARWPDDTTDNAIDVWPSETRPADMDAGINEIWNDYVVPRREHLYVTHSVTNTAKAIGYGSNLNAGIPEAQSPIATLAQNIVLDFSQHAYGVVVVSNLNDEVVDMSGWILRFGVDWTLPPGTVCDSNDCIYVVRDRRAFIADHASDLTDEVIVGNATFNDWSAVYLDSADGTALRGVSSGDGIVTFEAKNQEAADKLVAELSPALAEEDRSAGLLAEYLKVVAEPTGKKGEFAVAVAVNPDTVPVPAIAEPETQDDKPVTVEEDGGKKVVSARIGNAVKGLWYGYEVADELGEAAVFSNDVGSFERATNATHTVIATPRTQPSGFFRVKAAASKPKSE